MERETIAGGDEPVGTGAVLPGAVGDRVESVTDAPWSQFQRIEAETLICKAPCSQVQGLCTLIQMQSVGEGDFGEGRPLGPPVRYPAMGRTGGESDGVDAR